MSRPEIFRQAAPHCEQRERERDREGGKEGQPDWFLKKRLQCNDVKHGSGKPPPRSSTIKPVDEV